MTRRVALGLGGVLIVAAAFVLIARLGWFRPEDAELRDRYALPQSHFITVGRQSLHIVDEGSGPPVILVHGSYASLRMWRDWVEVLKVDHRVIRFDRPGMGLSGPSPDARYDGEAEAELIGALADQLVLKRFALAGTSSSGEGVAHFAALHPERVSALILANVAAGPIKPTPNHFPFWFRATLAVDSLFKGWHTPLFWRGILEANYADTAKVTPELVAEWTALNNRAQGWTRKPWPGGVPFAGTPADLAALKMPVLLLWSDRDPEVPLERDGRQAKALVASPDKTLEVISHCGHMLPLECGPQSAAAARSFLTRVSGGGKAL